MGKYVNAVLAILIIAISIACGGSTGPIVPSDVTAPMVSSTTPANLAKGIAINLKPTVVFSEAMDPLTINNKTFTLTGPGTNPVSGTVTYTGTTATFRPFVTLPASTLFTFTISTEVKDLAGNSIANHKVWSFTTGAAPDVTAPTVSSTVPANSATGVALNLKPTVVFSEAMDPLTITNVTFKITGPGATPVAGKVSYVGTTATFSPLSTLAANTQFTATISTNATDLADNSLASAKVWSFTTGAAPDVTAPTVSSTVPAKSATGVAVNIKPTAVFSEAMDPLTITNITFSMMGPGATPVSGTVTYVGTTATFSPLSTLAASTLFTATISTGVTDLADNALASTKVWSFTTGAAPDITAPTVSSSVPANSATGVALNLKPTVVFSEAMDSLTITNVTFKITGPGATPVAGSVSYVGTTATFSPLSTLAASTLFTATISTGVTDLADNALASAKVWSFTTGAAPDNTAPTVSSTVPAHSATGVALNMKPTAVFSEAMDPLTLTNVTFKITGPGATPVAGSVSYVGSTATFSPLSTLAASTLFTATISTGVTDLADNALASAKVWSFTTGAAPDITAPTVSSTVPANSATGVAVNMKPTAVFSEAMDPLTLTNVTFKITGPGTTPVAGSVSYVGTTATFSPMSTLAANTLFTATISTGGTDLADNALASAKVWSFTTGAAPDITAPTVSSTIPANSATGVALNIKPTAVFSEAMDPLTLTNVSFKITGPGATPVAGSVSYVGSTATFSPLSTLAASTLFTVTISTGGTDLADNALASAKVWSFTTGAAPDITAPTVSSTVPANSATGVALNIKPTAVFSEAMDPLTLTNVTFKITGPGATPVAGSVSYVGSTATFSPLSTLAASTLFTATISTGATDLADNALASAKVWSFTTGAAPDITAPTVSSTVPANSATGVAISMKPTAVFSEAMDPLTITNVTFKITGPGATQVSGTVSYVGTTATFSPLSTLAANTLFTATISTGATDLANNAKASAKVWSFTTGAAPDTTAPTVSSTVPANSATGVAISMKPTAVFSEAMDPLTLTNVTFTMAGPSTTPVAGTVSYVGSTATFSPLNTLAANTLFTATISTGVTDLADNALASAKVWSFTTGAAPDITAPTVSSTVPANSATGVAISMKPTAVFSEAMDPLTITNVTFTMAGPGTTPVAGTVSYVGTTATFSPLSTLAANTLFTATISTGATDLANNAKASAKAWSFTTGAAPDTTAPTVSSTVPANSATGVAISMKPTAVFSEAIDPLTMTNISFSMMNGATPVAGTVSYVGTTATFSPLSTLAANTLFTVTISTGVTDLANNALASAKVWSFTTGAAPDTIAPTVSSTVPANSATGVAISMKPTAVFSEAIDPLTMTNISFSMMSGATPVSGTVSYVGTTATFSPLSTLAANTLFTVTISTGVTDLADNALASAKVWSFTTGAAPDTTAPTVSSTVPANSTTAVALSMKPTAVFSEAIDPLTMTNISFSMMSGATPVSGTVSYVGTTATFSPLSTLAANTLFTVTISTGVTDLANNALASAKVWSFTTGAAPDITAPLVIIINPADLTTEVPISRQISVTFDEALDSLTINNVTFTLSGPVGPVTGAVSYVGLTATFTPSSNLLPNSFYTATITTGVKDLATNALASPKGWSFTTGAAPDSTPPSVVVVNPANQDVNVPISRNVAATFSEAMDPLTITTANYSLMNGLTAVTGTVGYAGTVATFTPSANLESSTLYTATISTGATDLSGNPLLNNKVWSFTTGVGTVALNPINLGQTSRFALLAGFAITNVPASMITGDMGISPAAQSFITGFSQTDSSGYSTSPQVTGYIYGADMISPTPAMLTQAKGDLTIAYNDAAARTPVPTGTFLNPGAGNLAGLTLVPGLYKFTEQAIATTDFTLMGGANDVWIFQIATDLIISNGVQLILAGGAKAENIFWKVGTQATLGTTVKFHGTLMAEASITMNTGASLKGRALAFTGTIALNQNTITIPDSIAPMLSSLNPSNHSLENAINRAISVTFSEAMDPTTITTTTFKIAQGEVLLAGNVSYYGTTATFTPSSPFSINTAYTGNITTGVKDFAANALDENIVWSFTTGANSDIIAPTVSLTTPLNSALDVNLNRSIRVIFSEGMNPSTVNSTNFTVTQPGSILVAGTVTYVGETAIFNPQNDFLSNTDYSATITTGVKDLAENALTSNKVWSFTTGSNTDATAPSVSSMMPSNSESSVALNQMISATFSEALDPLSLSNRSFVLEGPGAVPVVGTVDQVGAMVTFTPSANLVANTQYSASISTRAKDLADHSMASNKVWTFTTGAFSDITPPTVSSTFPVNFASNVVINTKLSAIFSEGMDPRTMTNVSFSLTGPGVTPVDGAVTLVCTTATFRPTNPLATNTVFVATITTTTKDLAGIALTANKSWSFTTGTNVDTTAATVVVANPANLAIDVPISGKIAVTFSEVMDSLSINTATFTLAEGSTPVSGTVISSGVTSVFASSANLKANTLYSMTLSTGVTDLGGNPLANPITWSFTTHSTPDTTPPTVVTVDPADLTVNVPIRRNITTTFSEAMNPLTITTANFSLMQGTMPVLGSVNYVGTMATFTPSANLLANTLYTATISNKSRDLAENALGGNTVWSFTTGEETVALIPVVLGQTAHFAVLAGAAITNVPASIITGDLGVSPAAQSYITGFSQTDYTGYALSPQISGFIYSADMASPTPAMMTQAKGDLTIGMTDASGRTPIPTGAFLNPGTGNLAGMNLVPGLYKFTGDAIATANFNLTGGENDVWIFQVATALIISNNVKMTLSGGARAKNIFWQVGSQATLGASSSFQGTLLAENAVTLGNAAILNGRALAFTGTIVLNQNTITVPAQ